ncbi:thiamine-phosphate kinase [Marinobacterium arenosum]|uniref:thiamine-phosphate kinase n=1 Tax=Marinobacterium arenosum TaxID=2862496 RepID=UPI001C967672|nr:thiamine-phosphate kinase [Marinobacterium arenosum]MBY4675545.1 thiamine-phosphate kinase [Marinobacterium arenosum]
MGEFELIRRYFARQPAVDSVALGIGDDCALLQLPIGRQLAVSIDTLVEGTHFLAGSDPARLAERLLGAAVSDLAGMAAEPLWFTLALTLPEADPAWLEPFARRLSERAADFGIVLVGGDTTRGHRTMSVQVHGAVEPGRALTRRGAQPGDLVCVTGTLGDSRGGLQTLLDQSAASGDVDWLRQRFYCPEPRLAVGHRIGGIATAGLDISDGLLADLGHLLEDGLGAEIELDGLPLSAALVARFGREQARQWALSGGEDFELCFTLPEAQRSLLASLSDQVTVVGRIEAESGLRLRHPDGRLESVAAAGFDHFPDN